MSVERVSGIGVEPTGQSPQPIYVFGKSTAEPPLRAFSLRCLVAIVLRGQSAF
jgi:hypothetical protein